MLVASLKIRRGSSKSPRLVTSATVAPSLLSMTLLLLLSFVTVVVNGQGGDPNFNFDSLKKTCPRYSCGSGLSPVPKSRSVTKFTSEGGCAAMGSGGMMMMQPGKDGADKPYEQCCHQWHACYQICGSSKKTCDEKFQKCAETKCDLDNIGDADGAESCKKDLGITKIMIDLGGCQKYDQQQYQNCDCVSKEKVEEKRGAALRSFYKKYGADDAASKVDGLVKKADTTSKFAGLFMKLIEKYSPDCIAVKGHSDPMKEYMEKIKLDKEKEDSQKESEDTGSDEEDEEHEKIEL